MSNTRRFFGTDGIRGKANTPPMTVDVAQKLGQAAGGCQRGCQAENGGDGPFARDAQRGRSRMRVGDNGAGIER
ncbi:hypothetical protein KUA11_17390, partial [Acetobacter estunensis]|nr:hypothetical protein [Acetobacter estunensis]